MAARSTSLGRFAALAALGLATVGCNYVPDGGFMASSNGPRTFYSTETMQKTVTLTDTRTGEPVFVQAIPPGFQLTLRFLEGGGDDPVNTPDRMMYGVLELGTKSGRLPNQLTVPNSSSRRLDVKVTQEGEFAAPPPEERLRTDEVADRPDYWTPAGGPLPERRNIYDD